MRSFGTHSDLSSFVLFCRASPLDPMGCGSSSQQHADAPAAVLAAADHGSFIAAAPPAAVNSARILSSADCTPTQPSDAPVAAAESKEDREVASAVTFTELAVRWSQMAYAELGEPHELLVDRVMQHIGAYAPIQAAIDGHLAAVGAIRLAELPVLIDATRAALVSARSQRASLPAPAVGQLAELDARIATLVAQLSELESFPRTYQESLTHSQAIQTAWRSFLTDSNNRSLHLCFIQLCTSIGVAHRSLALEADRIPAHLRTSLRGWLLLADALQTQFASILDPGTVDVRDLTSHVATSGAMHLLVQLMERHGAVECAQPQIMRMPFISYLAMMPEVHAIDWSPLLLTFWFGVNPSETSVPASAVSVASSKYAGEAPFVDKQSALALAEEHIRDNPLPAADAIVMPSRCSLTLELVASHHSLDRAQEKSTRDRHFNRYMHAISELWNKARPTRALVRKNLEEYRQLMQSINATHTASSASSVVVVSAPRPPLSVDDHIRIVFTREFHEELFACADSLSFFLEPYEAQRSAELHSHLADLREAMGADMATLAGLANLPEDLRTPNVLAVLAQIEEGVVVHRRNIEQTASRLEELTARCAGFRRSAVELRKAGSRTLELAMTDLVRAVQFVQLNLFSIAWVAVHNLCTIGKRWLLRAYPLITQLTRAFCSNDVVRNPQLIASLFRLGLFEPMHPWLSDLTPTQHTAALASVPKLSALPFLTSYHAVDLRPLLEMIRFGVDPTVLLDQSERDDVDERESVDRTQSISVIELARAHVAKQALPSPTNPPLLPMSIFCAHIAQEREEDPNAERDRRWRLYSAWMHALICAWKDHSQAVRAILLDAAPGRLIPPLVSLCAEYLDLE